MTTRWGIQLGQLTLTVCGFTFVQTPEHYICAFGSLTRSSMCGEVASITVPQIESLWHSLPNSGNARENLMLTIKAMLNSVCSIGVANRQVTLVEFDDLETESDVSA